MPWLCLQSLFEWVAVDRCGVLFPNEQSARLFSHFCTAGIPYRILNISGER
jgi:hypothetical protein